MKLPVLALASLLALTGCGRGDKPSSKPTTTPTALVSTPAVGTVQGQLLHAGGPAGVGSGPWPGKLRIVGPNTHLEARIGKDGRFSILLPPGKYAITATSPNYNGGRSRCATTPRLTEITIDKTVTADVICVLM